MCVGIVSVCGCCECVCVCVCYGCIMCVCCMHVCVYMCVCMCVGVRNIYFREWPHPPLSQAMTTHTLASSLCLHSKSY